MNFEELKRAATDDNAPEITAAQSLIIIATEDKGPRISVQTASIGTPMHLAQAIDSILKQNPCITAALLILSEKRIEKELDEIEKEKNQAKYN